MLTRVHRALKPHLKMGSKYSDSKSGFLLSSSVVEIRLWVLLLLLVASPLRHSDFADMFTSPVGPAPSISWPDQMRNDVIFTLANALKFSHSTYYCGSTGSSCSSGTNHPLVGDQNLSYFKPWPSSRGSNDSYSYQLRLTSSFVRRNHVNITHDPTFGEIIPTDDFSYVYFGSSNGTSLAFPGSDEDVVLGLLYDPRRCPWKQHRILIDTGSSMGYLLKEEFRRAPDTSYLNVTQEIAAEFLKTLSPKDKVDVFSFNATEAYSSYPQVKLHGADRSNLLPRLSPTGTKRSNLSAAILEGILTFQLDKSSLNVILVFSDGNFEPLSLYPKVLAPSQIKVMKYILPHNSEADQNMMLSTNLPLLFEVKGYFEMLDATSLVKPLYWISGYFSFLVQPDSFLCNSKWSAQDFLNFTEMDISRNAFPGFGYDHMLLRVASQNVQVEDITEILPYVKAYNKTFTWFNYYNHQSDGQYLKDFGLASKTISSYIIRDIYYCELEPPPNNDFTLIIKFSPKFILISIILSISFVLIIIWIKKKPFVFFNYNRESNSNAVDIESNSNEIDHIGSIFYNNRDINIQLLSPLGSPGSSGIVSRVMLLGVECAMKVFHPYAKKDFMIEATTLIRLNHAHIVNFYCIFGDFSIVMELMDIDLFSFITNVRDYNNNYNLPLEVALKIMIQIAKGMSYLHQCGIAHQDLKSLNILLKLQGQVHNHCNFEVIAKVADFGNARAFDPSNPTGYIRFPRVNVGTRAWRAPELSHMERTLFVRIFGMYPYVMLKPLDIYAFGIICHELLMGQLPTTQPPRLPLGKFPGELVTLIEDCCHINPLHRPKFHDICQRLVETRASMALNAYDLF